MAKGTRSYAQNGEDLICSMLLGKQENVTYVDIGCLWPVQQSNTFYFYERGGHGLCIDPNPSVAAMFSEQRPRDVYVNMGVADQTGQLVYHQYANPVYNTFSAARAEELTHKQKEGCRLLETMPVKVGPLANILADAGFPGGDGSVDLLSIDSEGFEEAILKSIDFSAFKPRLIIFEYIVRGKHLVNAYEIPLVRYLNIAGYDLVAFTGHDLYMRRR